MGNQVLCSEAKLRCGDNCTRISMGEHKEPMLDEANHCDPAGAVFAETLEELNDIDRQLLLFSGGSNVVAVRWLVELGANRLACDSSGTTCLHTACRSGSLAVVDSLIRLAREDASHSKPAQDSLATVDVAGWTPLHTAAFMSRADVVGRLLHAGVPADRRTSSGKTAADLCNDGRTRSLLSAAVAGQSPPGPKAAAANGNVDLGSWGGPDGAGVALSVEQVMVGGRHGASKEVRFEPFFVPRHSVIKDGLRSAALTKQLVQIGRAIFDRQPGRGLAFLVATGCVRDYPMNLVGFLQHGAVDPVQIGLFLGEEFSLSKILRMEFINALGFANCGVVACLQKAFASFKMPPDLQKVDRILHSLAEVWWRQHSRAFLNTAFPDLSSEEEALRQAAEAFAALAPSTRSGRSSAVSDEAAGRDAELEGFEVRRIVKSAAVMHQLFFSTTMLHWSMTAALPRSQVMSLKKWLQLHQELGATSELPDRLLKPIYDQLAGGPGEMPEAWIQSPPESQDRSGPDVLAAFSSVQGWVRIMGDGLPTLLSSVGGNSTAPAADCLHMSSMLSESTASSRKRHPDRHLISSRGPAGASRPVPLISGEAKEQAKARARDVAWLSLGPSLLFLSTGPEPSCTPFAFVHLEGAKLSGIEPGQGVFAVEGRVAGGGNPELAGLGAEEPPAAAPPPGATGLQLVLLLPDGRWQHYNVPKLIVEVSDRSQLESWVLHLNEACTTSTTSLLSV